jgi:hypothetical protein
MWDFGHFRIPRNAQRDAKRVRRVAILYARAQAVARIQFPPMIFAMEALHNTCEEREEIRSVFKESSSQEMGP